MSEYMNGPIPIDLRKNPFTPVQWEDDLEDPVTGEVLEEGTTFWAEYANNKEWGIWNAFEFIAAAARRLERIEVQLEIDGRVDPDNRGTFIDNFDGAPNKMIRHEAMADITAAVTVGTTVLPVDKTTGFMSFTQVTVYDGTNSEDTLITAIDEGMITVQALAHDYVKGARVARGNAKIADGQMIRGDWGTYTVSMMEVV